mgnify:FL=1
MKKLIDLYRKHREIVNYLIVGVLTTVVSLVVYYGLTLTVLDPEQAVQLQAANVISWIAAVVFAYFTNRRFVFESRSQNMLKEAVAFFAARLSTLVLDMALMFLLVTLLKCNDKIAKLVVQAAVIVANYVLSKFLVFKKKEK